MKLSGQAAICSGVPVATICAAAGAALGAKIDDVIGDLDDVEIVLDDEHRVARVHQPLQDLDELVHVRHVQARRRLVEDVERAARRALRTAPWPASRAAPRRRRASWRSGRA